MKTMFGGRGVCAKTSSMPVARAMVPMAAVRSRLRRDTSCGRGIGHLEASRTILARSSERHKRNWSAIPGSLTVDHLVAVDELVSLIRALRKPGPDGRGLALRRFAEQHQVVGGQTSGSPDVPRERHEIHLRAISARHAYTSKRRPRARQLEDVRPGIQLGARNRDGPIERQI